MAQGKTPQSPETPTPKTQAQAREERLKAALKANMGRRKQQARGRALENRAAESQATDNTDPKGATEESS